MKVAGSRIALSEPVCSFFNNDGTWYQASEERLMKMWPSDTEIEVCTSYLSLSVSSTTLLGKAFIVQLQLSMSL